MKKIQAAAILGGLVVASTLAMAVPAFAHDAVLEGSAVCNSDGTRSVTWTYNAINVPAAAEAEVKIIKHEPSGTLLNGVDAQLFLSVWSSHSINQPGVPTKTGNWSQTFTQTGFGPLDTTATIQSQGDWNDGASDHDPTLTIPLPANCVAPTATPTPTTTASTPPVPTSTPTEVPSSTPTSTPTSPATNVATSLPSSPPKATSKPTETAQAHSSKSPKPRITATQITKEPESQSPNPKELASTGFSYDPRIAIGAIVSILVLTVILLFIERKFHVRR